MSRAKRFAVCLVAVQVACLGDPLPPGPEAEIARAYLAVVVNLMEAGSINRAAIDWTAFRSRVTGEGASARRISDTYLAIQTALTLLDDKHSYFRTPGGNFFVGRDPLVCSGSLGGRPNDLPPDIGWVRVGAYGGSSASSASYTGLIQTMMMLSDTTEVVGWVVDLRGNAGGNMWPMLVALWPFLQGTAGHFVDPDEVWSRWELVGEEVRLNGETMAIVADGYGPRGTDGRVAVLVDGGVASAGEGIVVAFHGRPNTRTFGTTTCGQSTAITLIPLSDGGALGLTTATMADRDSVRFGGPITPDETITGLDAQIIRAIEWIRTGL